MWLYPRRKSYCLERLIFYLHNYPPCVTVFGSRTLALGIVFFFRWSWQPRRPLASATM